MSVVDVYTDVSWAGCRESRKSTSGGCILFGNGCVRTWSKTQATTATSSAESELLACVKGAAESIGIVPLGADLGLELKFRLHMDAAAAVGILERRGVGKVRHLDVGTLWLQETQIKKIIEMKKVAGLLNPGYLLTKHLSRERVYCYTSLLNYRFPDGRAAAAAGLHSMECNGNDMSRFANNFAQTIGVDANRRYVNVVEQSQSIEVDSAGANCRHSAVRRLYCFNKGNIEEEVATAVEYHLEGRVQERQSLEITVVCWNSMEANPTNYRTLFS